MMTTSTPTIETLVAQVGSDFPDFDTGLLDRAYEVAAEAHQHQKRKTGEPYINHCLATAAILAELRLDPPVIVAGLLHDTVEDTDITQAQVRQEFGDEVARLVDGVTKLSQISVVTGSRKRDLNQEQAENLRKMFLAMSEDPRIVPIKLADRLHNMRTLHGHSREKQIRISRETMDIFAPLANRLGIWQIKWELEDLCLRYLEPELFQSLVERLDEQREERDAFIAGVVEQLRTALSEVGIQADIRGRGKHIYSIYKKMRRKDRDLDQIFDVRALRVVVADRGECYSALGVVHGLWHPIMGEFDDYIANPKENNYRSLHTAVYVPQGKATKTLEVQIRDQEMHQFAEYGFAAHWRYKEQRGRDRHLDERVRFFRQMLEWRSEDDDSSDATEFMDTVRTDVLPTPIYVFTPRGEIKELPAGATPIDFAYYIHTDIGHKCSGAKINGRMVNLNSALKDGDQIEILTTNKRAGPSRDWLNPYQGYVRTARARSKIRAWFRHQDRDENIRQGREALERELRRLGLREKLERLSLQQGYSEPEDFFAALGCGDLSPHSIATALLEQRQKQEAAEAQQQHGIEAEVAAFRENQRAGAAPSKPSVSLDGMSGMMIRRARCCNPVVGDEIIGYTTRGSGISVHRADCANVRSNKLEAERLTTMDWGNEKADSVFPVNVRILALDRDGLLRDILDVVANEHVNMSSVNAVTNKLDQSAVVTAVLEVHDATQLSRILAHIRCLSNVFDAHRATN